MNTTYLARFKNWARSHKIATIIIGLIVLIIIYFVYRAFHSSASTTRYVVGTASRTTLVSSISGTGQVSGSSQIDVKSKVAGDIVSVNVKTGDSVTAGQLLAQVDARDAESNLESARLAYQKLVKPADEKDVTNAQDAVTKSYNDSWNAVSGTFLDLPTISTGLKDLLNSNNGYLNDNGGGVFANNPSARNLRSVAVASFNKAEAAYTTIQLRYNRLSRSSATSSLEAILGDTAELAQYYAQALKDARAVIVFLNTNEPNYSPSAGLTAANNVNTWSATINSDSSTLVAASNSLTSNKNALTKLLEGADSLDVASEQLALKQKEQAYDDYFIRAPFAGLVGKIDINLADTVSGSTVIATIVSEKKIADISLNEVDVSKIKVGNKATLTFDAIEGLSISGKVSEIDQVGTVTSGVVTYNVKITFDTDDIRIKPGMSVSAAIVTEVKTDVLVVPNGAIKTSGDSHYVLVFNPPLATSTGAGVGISTSETPSQLPVEVGSSNDTETEVTSGLSEGEQVVTRTINPPAASPASTPSLFGSGNRPATNANRTISR